MSDRTEVYPAQPLGPNAAGPHSTWEDPTGPSTRPMPSMGAHSTYEGAQGPQNDSYGPTTFVPVTEYDQAPSERLFDTVLSGLRTAGFALKAFGWAVLIITVDALLFLVALALALFAPELGRQLRPVIAPVFLLVGVGVWFLPVYFHRLQQKERARRFAEHAAQLATRH